MTVLPASSLAITVRPIGSVVDQASTPDLVPRPPVAQVLKTGPMFSNNRSDFEWFSPTNLRPVDEPQTLLVDPPKS